MAGYVFLSNSSKPTKSELLSRDKVWFTNVSKPCLEIALEMGYKVYFGVNRTNPENLECDLPINLYDSHTYRSLTDLKSNTIAFNNLFRLVKKNNIEVIHCNTPIGGMIGRLVGKLLNVKKIIYTAHGFHFYKGAPLINNTVLKWAELLMARWTDVIITMNKEDYMAAKKFKLRNNGNVYYIPGVGIDVNYYKNTKIDVEKKRSELGLDKNDFVLITVGDLVANKNMDNLIKVISLLKQNNFKLLICGSGPEKSKLLKMTDELKITDQIKFLGFRSDVNELYKASDAFISISKREGLPRVIMEAMASGLPCIVSNIRGNVDLVDNYKGGYVCDSDNLNSYTNAIYNLYSEKMLQKKFSEYNEKKILNYDVSIIKEKLRNIYEIELFERG
ncbi:glycosyltransferase family 4 protein [Facklamia hominis]